MVGRRRRAAAVAAAMAILCAGCARSEPDSSDPAASRLWGYLALDGGERIRYSVLLPGGGGPHPVLVEYDGYSAGSDPDIGRDWLAEGYAIVGVNVPGTGCSTGVNHIFDETVGAAGAAAVEWAARQPWSNGRVGMIGYSYSGYNQLWTAAQRPEGLRAITPSKNVADPYRDVGYPGGIQNVGFPADWWNGFAGTWQHAARQAELLDGDTECAAVAAANTANARRPDIDITEWLDNDPYFGDRYASKSAYLHTGRIEVPALGTQSWQDEQVGPRAGYYEETMDPERMWLISSNGDHHTDLTAPDIHAVLKRFLAHFVKGEDNGFDREPHVRLLQEMQVAADGEKPRLTPTSVAEFDRLPVPVTPMRLWLQPDGRLDATPPALPGASARYRYPDAGAAVNVPGDGGWNPPATGDGQLTFTTGALPEDLSLYGPGSADLWLSSSAPDTDVQITVSEVRPDGQEMYVQRGWLRASQRALDPSRSTELRPWGDFTAAAAAPLVPGEPTPLRVEIQKFAHVFRAGSSIRVTIDTPAPTGYWVFGTLPTPADNTVWFEPGRLSSIVLGHTPYPHAERLPDCATTAQQPCRANTVPVPEGPGPAAPS
ncbi:CocE/NonD family hydrolase [Nocardia otitidiscaviarum]|uniref:CocE/NonD family hydrolase n=1 Tax=Nocardia otitidiscaviarum TaxID=1823 RepID=UPI00189547E3|nr:CocE/NonD family hydrolase [Nocardia otitidiscaviarum]MBF6182171.1 CocE/NonD family hydrolase [Nocardia otitidiscaviarum]